MSRGLRGAAAAGCTALLCASAVIGAPSAFADATPTPTPTSTSTPAPAPIATPPTGSPSSDPSGSQAFSMAPAYAQVGQTVVLTAADGATFPTDGTAAVRFNDVEASAVAAVSATQLDVVVPSGATSGPVEVVADATTYPGPTFTLQQPTSWFASLSPSSLIFGHMTTIGAQLTTSGIVNGPVAGVLAVLQYRSSPSASWHNARGASPETTTADGRVSWRLRPAANGEYRVEFDQTAQFGSSASTPLPLAVRPQIKVTPLRSAPAMVPTHITGSIKPRLTGPIYLERRHGRKWHRIKRTQIEGGHFSFTITPSGYAPLHERVVRPGDLTHTTATSRVLNIQVLHRDLGYGSEGPDVLALQKRLRALHYDVGAKSSYYGWDLLHAVTAFQKVQGLDRTGVATASTWSHLAHPKAPHLVHPHVTGTSVEVNLTSQILMIAKNGKIWRILDTSTAGGYTYTDSAGYAATAITPTGYFHIQYKIDKLVTDKLGTLFRPSYFDSDGDAIHGEGDTNSGSNVPPYPASHGCVRITDSAVDRYYDVFAVGVPVWIYYANSHAK
ncbi:MAG TPA: L,D-transpeptidase family protein [Mycobacteriales bacterium]|nr:L,D-transpeptidase family protein [Mycobacteriales bacterium]